MMEIRKPSPFSLALLLSAGLMTAFLGLIHNAQASGAGTIIMQQASDNGELGKWTILTPDGRTYSDHRGEHMEKIQVVSEGTYVLSVEPPINSRTSTIVYVENRKILITNDYRIAFSAPTGANIRVVMTHRSARENEESMDYVKVELVPDKSEILPGDSVNYTIKVSNLTLTTLRNLSASVQIDPGTGEAYAVKDGGIMQEPGKIEWSIPYLYSGKSWTTEFSYKAYENLQEGDTIAMTSSVKGTDLVEAKINQIHIRAKVGMPVLPKTGWRAASMFLAALSAVSLILAITTRRRQYVQQMCRKHIQTA